MRLVATKRVPSGVRLARDVFSGRPGEIPLLRAGTPIGPEYRDALMGAGIHAVYVDDELSAGIQVEQPVTQETRQEAASAIATALDDTQAALAAGRRLSVDSVAELGRIAALIVRDVTACDGAILALSDLASADAYTVQHSIDVAALGVLLGQRLFREQGWVDYRGLRSFDRIEQRLARLGLGLLLHDIGKLAIPAEVLTKRGALDEGEVSIVRRHPLTGIELLKGGAVSPLVRAVVRSHHERWDGRGYPEGRQGETIHEFARLASVADVYDALTSERPYRPAQPPHVGVQAILAGAGSHFDPEIVEVFRRTVSPYPPGSEVALTDGRWGVVSFVPPERPDRPVVRLAMGAAGNPLDRVEVAIDAAELQLGGSRLAA
jgi:HD-GYP domain-containing protein (c-di-GMP phosphodiesterase class II)